LIYDRPTSYLSIHSVILIRFSIFVVGLVGEYDKLVVAAVGQNNVDLFFVQRPRLMEPRGGCWGNYCELVAYRLVLALYKSLVRLVECERLELIVNVFFVFELRKLKQTLEVGRTKAKTKNNPLLADYWSGRSIIQK
jgi:hypothetical protein